MNILLCYGKHPFTTGEFIEKSLRKYFNVFSCGTVLNGAKHDLTITDPYIDIYSLIKSLDFKPDLVFFIESGVEFFPINIDKIKVPTIYYSIDAHFNYNWQKNYFYLFDYAFITFRQFIDRVSEFIDYTPIYLPHGYDSSIYFYKNEKKDINISFVGDLSRKNRLKLINKLKKYDIKIYTNIWGEEVRKIYSRSKLVLNDNTFGVLNPRNFEASSCRSVVLANPAVDLENFFKDNESIIIYNSIEELDKKVDFLLKNSELLDKIAKKAQEVAFLNTWDKRIESVRDKFFSFKEKREKSFAKLSYALMFLKRGIYSKSYEFLQVLLKENPNNFIVLISLAKLYLNIGDYKNAEIYLEKAKSLNSEHFNVLFLDALLTLNKDINKGIDKLLKINDKYKDYDVKYILSLFFLNSQKNLSIKLLKEAIEIDPYRFEARDKLDEILTT